MSAYSDAMKARYQGKPRRALAVGADAGLPHPYDAEFDSVRGDVPLSLLNAWAYTASKFDAKHVVRDASGNVVGAGMFLFSEPTILDFLKAHPEINQIDTLQPKIQAFGATWYLKEAQAKLKEVDPAITYTDPHWANLFYLAALVGAEGAAKAQQEVMQGKSGAISKANDQRIANFEVSFTEYNKPQGTGKTPPQAGDNLSVSPLPTPEDAAKVTVDAKGTHYEYPPAEITGDKPDKTGGNGGLILTILGLVGFGLMFMKGR